GEVREPSLSWDGRRAVALRDAFQPGCRAEVYAFSADTLSASVEPEFSIPVPVGGAAWLNRDGTVLLVSVGRDADAQRLVAFDLTAARAPEKPLWEIGLGSGFGRRPVWCLSEDGKRVAVQFGSTVEVWDGPAGKRLGEWAAPHYPLYGSGEWAKFGLSPDGK